MEKIVEQSLLFDFYGELLTEHQQKVYEDAVLNDMSLSEVADN
ncbi:MAG: DNA-binding protein, partial [Lachnospiraceae bacterium]|nr:DNA-binding protein [Lachnospiraceae bacterium]